MEGLVREGVGGGGVFVADADADGAGDLVAVVLSVMLSSQVVGSGVPSFQTRARMVVGLMPWNWTRVTSTTPSAAGMRC